MVSVSRIHFIESFLFQGSGHDLYGGFPGYSPMMFNGSGGVEQAMPATGLGLGPGNISPGSGLGPQGPPQMVQGLPPHYNGSYHPSYMQPGIQVGHQDYFSESHLQMFQHVRANYIHVKVIFSGIFVSSRF